jgi:hypothetical protein
MIWKYWSLGKVLPMIATSAMKNSRVIAKVNSPNVTGRAMLSTYGTLEMGDVPRVERVTRLIPRPIKKRPRMRMRQRLASPADDIAAQIVGFCSPLRVVATPAGCGVGMLYHLR